MAYYFISLKYFIFLASPFSTVILLNGQQFWPAHTQRIFEVIALDQKALQMEACNVCLRNIIGTFSLSTLFLSITVTCTITFDFRRLLSHLQGKIKSKILFYSQISHSTMYYSTSIYCFVVAFFLSQPLYIPKTPFIVPSRMLHHQKLAMQPQILFNLSCSSAWWYCSPCVLSSSCFFFRNWSSHSLNSSRGKIKTHCQYIYQVNITVIN